MDSLAILGSIDYEPIYSRDDFREDDELHDHDYHIVYEILYFDKQV